jgi:hypothetical protein
MKSTRMIIPVLILGLLLFTVGCSGPEEVEGTIMDPANTYVVLMEMNHFPEGYADLEVDFINTNQLEQLFSTLGVPSENMLIKKDELTLKDMYEAFDWLAVNTSGDSSVFFYVAAHGSYIHNVLAWNTFIPKKWNALEQENKILVVDSCMSGKFVAPFANEEASGITYAIVSADELGWWGIEEEGLPIIGSIWTHYFTRAVLSPEADFNGNQAISFTEAANYSASKVQEYMSEEVFAVDEFLELYQNSGKDPLLEDAFPNPVCNDHLDGAFILNTFE